MYCTSLLITFASNQSNQTNGTLLSAAPSCSKTLCNLFAVHLSTAISFYFGEGGGGFYFILPKLVVYWHTHLAKLSHFFFLSLITLLIPCLYVYPSELTLSLPFMFFFFFNLPLTFFLFLCLSLSLSHPLTFNREHTALHLRVRFHSII